MLSIESVGGGQPINLNTWKTSINVERGKRYRLGFWAKSNQPLSIGACQGCFYVYPYMYDGAGNQVDPPEAGFRVIPTTDWEYYQTIITMPSGAASGNLWFSFMPRDDIKYAYKIYIDDICMQLYTESV
jgi:hypothetical protein